MASSSRQGDGHLWMIAFGLSILFNGVILASVGLAALEMARLGSKATPAAPPPAETVATIFAEIAQRRPTDETTRTPVEEKRFARTSTDQSAPPDQSTPFIGERNTRATSDRASTSSAPALPSQAGIAPRDATEIETTESDYQDGVLASDSSTQPDTTPAVPDPNPPLVTPAIGKPDVLGTDTTHSTPPPREKLLQGPNPVDVQVPLKSADHGEIKPTPEKRPAAVPPPAPDTATPAKPVESVKPTPSREPVFKGYQRKTAVVGSISRTGRSALDVEDSPLGRYQAVICRAVEQEWQRNCVRHRDFITPGFLTVRFYVETGGKIRSVQFEGDMETGEVQKGFTLNSIRDAEIPAMPPALRKEYAKEPLELVFRFYF